MRLPVLPSSPTTPAAAAMRARNGRGSARCGSGSEAMLTTTEAATTTTAAIAPADDRPDEVAGTPAPIDDAGRFIITRPAATTAVRDDTSGQQDRAKPNGGASGPPA